MNKKQDTIELKAADYDFSGLTQDVMDLADIGSAVATVAKRAVLVTFLIGILVFIVFASPMSTVGAAFWGFGALVFGLGVGVMFGVWRLTRQRGEACIQATDRVVETLGNVHGDLREIPPGQIKGALSGLASDYLRGDALLTAAVGFVPGFLKPLARPIARPVVWGPRRIIERSTLKVIDELPTDQLHDSFNDGLMDDVAGLWDGARGGVEDTVNKILSVSMVPLIFAVVVAAIPLAIWIVLGFVVA